MENKLNIGYALTGSFCTLEQSLIQIENLVNNGHNVLPIMSYNCANTSTRFGKAEDFIKRIEKITGNFVIRTLTDAEPIGPKNLTDVMVVLPCTGNTISKLKNGIYDTPVTLAAKSHLRNRKPLIIGVSTNDALSVTAKNIGELMNYKHHYFIPLKQDNPYAKPSSIVCVFERLWDTIEAAINGKQLQPLLSC